MNLTEDDAKRFDMQDLEELTIQTDIPRFTDNLNEVALFLRSRRIDIDTLFYTDVLSYLPLDGLYEIDCPTVCFILDPQVFTEFKIALANHFDYVFISQKILLDEFKKSGLENVYWLPHACDVTIHGKRQTPKLFDVGFVGNPLGYRRSVLDRLKDRFNVHYERVFGVKMAEIFSASKMVVNFLSYGEINMRIFEAMASGSLLLTPYAPSSAIEELFEDRRHLVFYDDEEDLHDKVQYYLENAEEREAIAKAGMDEVISKHTYDIRISQIIDTIHRGFIPSRDRRKYDYFHCCYKGIWLLMSGYYEKALKEIKMAIEIDSSKEFGYNLMGLYYRKTGDLKKSVYCIVKALEMNPSYYDGYVNLACTFKELGDSENNKLALKMASQIRPFNIGHEYIL